MWFSRRRGVTSFMKQVQLMFIAVLSPYPEDIVGTLEKSNDTWKSYEKIDDIVYADLIISYGHRRIIRDPYLTTYKDRIINLHISYLPWNKGSDPNLWSFIDGTPKGVSIHILDKGLDTGPVLAQRELDISGTLATSYQQLREGMRALFTESWKAIRTGDLKPRDQDRGCGSYHQSSDKKLIWDRLPLGLATPIEEVEALGRSLKSR